MKAFEGYTYLDGGICAAKGFQASGTYCGIKKAMAPDSNEGEIGKEKNDIALVVADTLCNTAAVYTQNKVKGAPILVMKKHLAATGGKARALIANSKNANTCNADGEEKAEAMCKLTAGALGIAPEEVMVMSTGVIGQILPLEPIEKAIPVLCEKLSPNGNLEAATAIMTTDTVSKEVAVSFTLDGKTCHLGGMAKGSGMIHPNMATTLNCITTDAAISAELLQTALSDVVKVTYNCLSVDGDQSTNDTCMVMASGLAGNAEITEQNADYAVFRQALYIVMMNLTRKLAKDGEGASKLLECTVSGAKDLDTAIIIAKSVICSPLFKCAMFGADANWGRVLCAVGYAPAEFDIHAVSVTLASRAGSVLVCEHGAGVVFSEEEAKKIGAVDFLVQGTIYPDVVESGVGGESTVIKSHHNVGGLPDYVDFKEIIEPLRNLFKDEVRKAGLELGIPEYLVFRQPFPGPGLGIRIIGEVTAEKVKMVQDADAIWREEIDKAGIAHEIGQYFAALTNMRSVGVMGDERTYDYAIALRAVTTTDFMTAESAEIPWDVIGRTTSRIVNEVKHINRVMYDCTGKPPATIEFE